MNAATAMAALRSLEGRANPYPIYADLHRLGAVCAIDPSAGERYQFVVHGYDAANQVLRDPAYLVVDGAMVERGGRAWRDRPSLSALLTSMFFTNGPEHLRLRAAYSRVFTSRRATALKAPIAAIVADLLDGLAERGADGQPVDFMTEFALPMPGHVICELMGVPVEDRPWFLPRAHIFADLLDLGTSSDELLLAADQATVELTEYFGQLLAQRRRNPRDDMISGFAALETADNQVAEPELLSGLVTFFSAGYASTSHLLGNGVPLLLDAPDSANAIRDEDVALRYVDEILRIAPPTHIAVRLAGEDRMLDGLTIPAGSMVLVLIGAANHDPARYRDPATFDPDRPDLRSLAFGAGIHFCLGASLTRLEGQVAFPMLFDRFPKLALAGESTPTHRLTLNGYQTLSITLN